jgi:hypothetical protein
MDLGEKISQSHCVIVEIGYARSLRDVQIFSAQDPYVVATPVPSNAARVRTSWVASGGRDPKWKRQHCRKLLLVCEPRDEHVQLEVWNANVFSDDLIGKVQVPIPLTEAAHVAIDEETAKQEGALDRGGIEKLKLSATRTVTVKLDSGGQLLVRLTTVRRSCSPFAEIDFRQGVALELLRGVDVGSDRMMFMPNVYVGALLRAEEELILNDGSKRGDNEDSDASNSKTDTNNISDQVWKLGTIEEVRQGEFGEWLFDLTEGRHD